MVDFDSKDSTCIDFDEILRMTSEIVNRIEPTQKPKPGIERLCVRHLPKGFFNLYNFYSR
jgi:hypothetical protein